MPTTLPGARLTLLASALAAAVLLSLLAAQEHDATPAPATPERRRLLVR